MNFFYQHSCCLPHSATGATDEIRSHPIKKATRRVPRWMRPLVASASVITFSGAKELSRNCYYPRHARLNAPSQSVTRPTAHCPRSKPARFDTFRRKLPCFGSQTCLTFITTIRRRVNELQCSSPPISASLLETPPSGAPSSGSGYRTCLPFSSSSSASRDVCKHREFFRRHSHKRGFTQQKCATPSLILTRGTSVIKGKPLQTSRGFIYVSAP